MKYKKSALLLSLIATPAIVSLVDEAPVSANTYYYYDSQVDAVINLINQINPNNTTYNYYLTESYNAFYKLNTTQQQYVYNSNILFNYLNINNSNNNNTTSNQTIINTFSTKVYAISLGTTTFLRDLQEANRYYNALTAAQKMIIPHYLYSQVLTYNENLAKVRAVETSFNNLNILDAYYTSSYINTLQSYNALPYNYRYLIQDLAKKKADEYTQYHSLDHNRAMAQKVITAISNITTSSKTTDIENARAMYESLTSLQKSFVTNLADLRYIEDVQKNVENGWDPDFYDEEAEEYTDITVEDYGDTYYIYMPFSKMNKTGQTSIKVNNNITIKVPRSAVPVTSKNKNAVVTMTIEEYEGESYIFTAHLYDEPLEFAGYIDIELKNIAAADVILKADYTGNYIATPFTYRLSKHIIKTKTAGEYIVSNEKTQFYDIRTDSSRYEIELLAKRKIVSGVQPNYFRPNANVTIAQYASMISRAMDIRALNASSYNDVRGKWFENAIQALLENGILSEKQSNNFKPEEVVTRKQAAIMSIRMLEYAGIISGNPDYTKVPFKDFNLLSEQEKFYVAVAYEYGIFGGKSDGRFDPNAKLTRSQMAKVLHRTLQIAKMM